MKKYNIYYIPLMKGSQWNRKPTGLRALVDRDDYEKFRNIPWTFSEPGYARRTEGDKRMYLHREIMGNPKGLIIDHINGDKLDNRKCNLRFCTQSQNLMNRRANLRKKTSKYKGVTRYKAQNKGCKKIYYYWASKIMKNKKGYHIGYFKNERHAGMAYDMWAKDLFGEYAKLNFKTHEKE